MTTKTKVISKPTPATLIELLQQFKADEPIEIMPLANVPRAFIVCGEIKDNDEADVAASNLAYMLANPAIYGPRNG